MLVALKENEETLLDVHQKAFDPDILVKENASDKGHMRGNSKAGEAPQYLEITNHYGTYIYDMRKAIYFENGLYGLEHCHQFALRMLSAGKKHYYLLQSLEFADISFVVMPLLLGAKDGIALEDALKACQDLGLEDAKEAYFLGLLSMDDAGVRLNLRAPIIIDCIAKKAWQYLYHHDKYKVDHLLLE